MRIVERFVVSRSPAEVFDYIVVNYFENHQKFDPEIFGMINHTKGPVAVGTKGSEIRKVAGKKIRINFEVTDFDPAKFFAFANTSGPFYLERSYNFTKIDTGTEVTFIFNILPKSLLGKIGLSILGKTFQKNVHHNIQVLHKLLS